MKVRRVNLVDSCFDGTTTHEWVLDAPIDPKLVGRLAQDSTSMYFPSELPRPFFRIERRRKWKIKGVIGKRTFRVTLYAQAEPEAKELITQRVERDEPE